MKKKRIIFFQKKIDSLNKKILSDLSTLEKEKEKSVDLLVELIKMNIDSQIHLLEMLKFEI